MAYKEYWALIILITFLSGCSLTGLTTTDKGSAANKTKDTNGQKPQQQQSTEIIVASPLSGQQVNPIATTEDYNNYIFGIKETLDQLVDSLIVNDLTKAQSCFTGLDESGSEISMEQLQQEMETLHPIKWQIKEFRPIEGDKALIAVQFTMADGTVRDTDPFNILNLGDQWSVHFNSFSTAFHKIAQHMIKDFKNKG